MRISSVFLIGVLLITTILTGCIDQDQVTDSQKSQQVIDMDHGKGNGMGVMSVDKNGSTSINIQNLEQNIQSISAEFLSDNEKKGLVYMREEEKLARDVYLTLYEKWKLPIFNNIARSERTHMDAVKLLLFKYNITDPAADETVGQFSNPEFQKLYEELVEKGDKSLIDALEVGAMIEELDITDLQKWIATTDNVDIKFVYENLMKGSRNHLRAFTSTLKKYGVTYEPHYLNEEEYVQIVNSSMETGSSSH